MNNSHTNLPDHTVTNSNPNENEHLITDSFNKLAIQSLNFSNDQRKKTDLEALKKETTPGNFTKTIFKPEFLAFCFINKFWGELPIVPISILGQYVYQSICLIELSKNIYLAN